MRHLPSGIAVADMRLAISETFKNRFGEMVEKPVFVDVVVWDKQAENCAQYLSRGSSVLVDGRLELDEWIAKNGEKRSKLRVRAERTEFLGNPRREKSQSRPQVTNEPVRPEPGAVLDLQNPSKAVKEEGDENVPF